MHPLAITIITYNRPDDLLVLLKNIGMQKNAAELLDSVIIINNASSVSYKEVEDFIACTPAIPWQYVWSSENLGVARGRNKAILLARAPIIITLDDDASFGDDTALLKIIKLFSSSFAKENNIGAFCFKVFYKSTGELQASAFPHKKIEKYRNKDQFLTSYFIGCGHAILKEVYDQTGLYPTDFFYGMEEYDLSYRLLDLSYRIGYDSSVSIIHNESPKGRTTHTIKMQMMWVNKAKVAYRYLPLPYFISTSLMWSMEFLKKTSFNLKGFFGGWMKVSKIPVIEKRSTISKETIAYVKRVEGRMWY